MGGNVKINVKKTNVKNPISSAAAIFAVSQRLKGKRLGDFVLFIGVWPKYTLVNKICTW